MEYNAAAAAAAASSGGFGRQRLVLDRDVWQQTRPSLEFAQVEEAFWQMNLQHNEGMDPEIGPFPERPGEPDCAYYMRTGHCGYGVNCRYNHPPNRRQAAAASRNRGDYPERVGQPECQYYLKTGTCKFGATCKFHHPRDKAGTAGKVPVNVLGYPIRPNERECAYYLRTGHCQFGSTCKFHHPPPVGPIVSVRGSSIFTPVHSPTTPGPQPYPGGLPSWPMPRPSFIQSPRFPGPSSYTQLMVPPGIVSVPGWSTYPPQGQVGSISSPDGQQQALGGGVVYGTSHQADPSVAGIQGPFSPFPPGSPGLGLPPLHLPSGVTREATFPERPGQPECQFYMKTGDCKYGMTCRFHHPKDRIVPAPNCVLNRLGLPIRPGAPACKFFTQYGVCKFGQTCKFDHSILPVSFPQSISSPVDVPVPRHPIMSVSTAQTSVSLSPESAGEPGGGITAEHTSSSESRQQPSGVETLGADA